MVATTVMGMVLSAMPIGEYDKRLVILTREKGKITVFAKGARRPGSAFLACSNPFSFGDFDVYEGKSSYNLMAVEIKNYFEELRADLEGAYYGLYFLELSDYFTHENEDGTNTLKLLYQTLRALSYEKISRKLIRRIFELRMLLINGIAPQVFSCVKCQKENSIYYFSTLSGGILCEDCKKNTNDCIKIAQSTLYTLQYIITSPLTKLYTFMVTGEVMVDLNRILDNYNRNYVEKKMKSLDLLERLF